MIPEKNIFQNQSLLHSAKSDTSYYSKTSHAVKQAETKTAPTYVGAVLCSSSIDSRFPSRVP